MSKLGRDRRLRIVCRLRDLLRGPKLAVTEHVITDPIELIREPREILRRFVCWPIKVRDRNASPNHNPCNAAQPYARPQTFAMFGS
jgi:hypothetical protein